MFGGWDVFDDNMHEAAVRARVLEAPLLEKVTEPLSAIKPMKAVFDNEVVRRIHRPNMKTGANKMELAEQLRQDTREFKEKNGCSRLVIIWCGSTETFHKTAAVHQTLETFEAGLRNSDPAIAPARFMPMRLCRRWFRMLMARRT